MRKSPYTDEQMVKITLAQPTGRDVTSIRPRWTLSVSVPQQIPKPMPRLNANSPRHQDGEAVYHAYG